MSTKKVLLSKKIVVENEINGRCRIDFEISIGSRVCYETLQEKDFLLISLVGTSKHYAGQMQSDLMDFATPETKDKIQRLINFWNNNHLNDLTPGLKPQDNALKSFENRNNYNLACDYLKSIGLYKINGYEYGQKWLARPIDINELKIVLSDWDINFEIPTLNYNTTEIDNHITDCLKA